jgi:hypothetical protein
MAVDLVRADPGASIRLSMKLSEAEYKLYFRSGWVDLIRYGLQAAGDFWMYAYMPLRFKSYARAVGIYPGKKMKGDPLVVSGRLKEHTLATAHAEAVATQNRAYIDLLTPDTYIIKDNPSVPNYLKGVMMYSQNPVVRVALSRITVQELDRMSRVFENVVQQVLDNADRSYYRRGPMKGQLKSMRLTERALPSSRPRPVPGTVPRRIA